MTKKSLYYQNTVILFLEDFQMTERIFTQTPWEEKVGYCRALKIGKLVYLSGTTAIDAIGCHDNHILTSKKAYLQTKCCLEMIQNTLKDLDVPISKIVRTRMFVTDISLWEEYGRAHREYFKDHPPTTTMVEVSALIDPKMLIEIEADAYLGEP